MDPLTITASVAKITAVGLTSATALRELCAKFNDAGITIASICNETTIISASLVQIQALLLRDPQATSNQLHSRPELLATFDTALTGCMVVFSCLDDEVRKLTTKPTDARNIRWKTRLRAVWNSERMNELLVQLRGQQSAISVLIQVMQMESLSEMKQIIQDNSAVLEKVANRTQSLRQSNRHVPIPDSIFGTDTTRDSMLGEAVSRSSMAEFDFDELIITSRAYRRALAAARRQVSKGKRKINTLEGDLIDLSEPGASIPAVQVPREIFDDLRSLRLSMVDEQFDRATIPNTVDQMAEYDDVSSDHGSFYRSFQGMGLVIEESEEENEAGQGYRSYEHTTRTTRTPHENLAHLSTTLIPITTYSNNLSSSDVPTLTSKAPTPFSNASVASYTNPLASSSTIVQASSAPASASNTPILSSSALSSPSSVIISSPSTPRTPHTSISSSSTLTLSPGKTITDKKPSSDMGVQFLAASLFEFNAKSTQEAGKAVGEGGIPFLSYSSGEIFDVVSVHGEIWLAISQDDDSKQGWIWEKHFARISPDESSFSLPQPDLEGFAQEQKPERLSAVDEPTLVTESRRLGWGRSLWSGLIKTVDEISS